MTNKTNKTFAFGGILLIFLLCCSQMPAQINSESVKNIPVVLDSDTLFYINSGIGIFSAEKRAEEINNKLKSLSENDKLIYDSLKILQREDYLTLILNGEVLMAVTKADAANKDTTADALAGFWSSVIINKLNETREIYSNKSLLSNGGFSILFLALLVLFFWFLSIAFPRLYNKINLLDSTKIKSVEVKGKEFVSSSTIVKFLLIISKGLRFAVSLYAIYFFIVKTILLWPYTRKWDVLPFIKSFAFFIFYTVLFFALAKGLNALVRLMRIKYQSWKDTKIKSIKIKSVEVLSAERTIEALTFFTKAARFGLFAILFYAYITIAFSLFTFSETWAQTLLNYIIAPLKSVLNSFLNFLPNLFFIIVLIFVFNYIIKFVKFIFWEIDKAI